MGIRNDGEAVYCIGASRSGKTQYALHKVLNGKYPRLLIWDFQGQWAGILAQQGQVVEQVTGRAQLVHVLKGNKKPGIYAYTPPTFSKNLADEFSFFCGCALLFIKEKTATIVCEELAIVTKGGAATGYWQTLQTQGQKFGGIVFAIIQRAQEGDKTTMTQATEVVLFRQNQKDIPYVSESLGIPEQAIAREDLMYTRIDKRGNMTLGRMILDPNNPKNHRKEEKKPDDIQKT